MNPKLIVVGLLVLACSAEAPASDTELQVVVRYSPHRLLDAEFRRKVGDEVASCLITSLTGIAGVRVFDGEMERVPAWDHAAKLGLGQLDRWTSPDRAKTHFVEIDLLGQQFRIRSRQYDGSLGWACPRVRESTSLDRATVGRQVVDHVVSDFGLTGTIARSDGDRSASVAIAGGLSDDRLRDWVRPGDVFAIVQATGGRASEVPHAYFVASGPAEGGKILGRIESRFAKPLNGWEAGVFRVVRLGAAHDRVKLRVVGPDGITPAEVAVRLSAAGSATTDAVKEQGDTRGGRFLSTAAYDRLAFATVSVGDRVIARLPVAVLGSEATTIEVRTDPGGESAALGDADGRAVRNRAHDTLVRLSEDTADLRSLMQQGKNRAALGRVTEIVRRLEDDVARLTGDLAAFRVRSPQTPLDGVDRTMRDLRQQLQVLRDARTKLEQAVAAANSPEADQKRAAIQGLLARADQELQDADFDKSLATLDEILRQAADWPEVKARRDRLTAAWAVKSPAHKEARALVFGEWSKAQSLDDAARLLDAVQAAFATCKSVGDKLTPVKLHKGLIKAAGWAARRDEELRRLDGDDVARQTEQLRKTAGRLRTMLDEVEKYINEK
ncbi:MAG: hypothetical protein K1X57_09860 [Gemmataceae bacterium]|nr:hypothetical protein [Gemmataceae bacterium]